MKTWRVISWMRKKITVLSYMFLFDVYEPLTNLENMLTIVCST